MFLVDEHTSVCFFFNASGEGEHSLLTSGLQLHVYTHAGIPSHTYTYAYTKCEGSLAVGREG